MFTLRTYTLTAIFLFGVLASAFAQNVRSIDSLMFAEKYADAQRLMNRQVQELFAARNFDSLSNYIYYVGNTTRKLQDLPAAMKAVRLFVDRLKESGAGINTLIQVYKDEADFYSSQGQTARSVEAFEAALKLAESKPTQDKVEMGRILSNLSAMASRAGDMDGSQGYGRRAMRYLETTGDADLEALYLVYNNFATSFWYASAVDSARFYYLKALEILKRTDKTGLNLYYRPAIIHNNLAGMYSAEGKVTAAIAEMKTCIDLLERFMHSDAPTTKKQDAITFQLEATDNLGGIYRELGDYSRAHDLLMHSYKQKQAKLNKENPAIFISQILLGQLYHAMNQESRALEFLQTGLANIAKSDGAYYFWQADGYYALALIHATKNDTILASRYYKMADSLYAVSLQGDYDVIYLEFLRKAAVYYASTGKLAQGTELASRAYNYVIKTQGSETLTAFSHLLNMSEVYYSAGQYAKALLYSEKGVQVLDHLVQSSNQLLDSIRMESEKPKAILLGARAKYEMMDKRDAVKLSAMLTELKAALSLLERRKTILDDPADIGALMADHKDLVDFVKKITLELYRLTGEQSYGEALIDLHESGLYNRIRSRLDKSDTVKFANLPAEVLAMERKLKAELIASLRTDRVHDEKMSAYFRAVDQWNKFQQRLQREYPRYYQMRYASIFKSMDEVFKLLPGNITVIRYFFVDQDLFAMVGDKTSHQLFPLDRGNVDDLIKQFTQLSMDPVEAGVIYFSLYNKLWKPLESAIRFPKIVIIPDGILFNLNFEVLTPGRIHSFQELATGSLLAKYTISYHYSLFLVSPQPSPKRKGNFVAFAPGFSDEVKKTYRGRSDSIGLDNSYLSLLPQPFTVALARSARRLLGGDAFLNDRSTAASFKANAGQHRIIHIGTHAESNNIHPEYSRLIFAKEASEGTADNSVYLYDLYSFDLSSDLTVLTACETGVPGMEDGEGMISLAHAFNYAGSESMLTGLWKIDEQTSARLMDLFYAYLKEGLDKDEALRHAKLAYLKTAKGRTLAPVYWAGLVLMGETRPVELEESGNLIGDGWLIAIAILIVSGATLIYLSRRKRRLKPVMN